jgi:hypothetical protein
LWLAEADLLGAVIAEDSEGQLLPPPEEKSETREANKEEVLCFSLVGVQLKFSAIGRGGKQPGAHKNTWIKTKVDLSSVPHPGVARDSVTRAVLLRDRPVSGALKRFVRKGFGQGLGNEVLFFCFCPFGRGFVCVLLPRSKCAARGSV